MHRKTPQHSKTALTSIFSSLANISFILFTVGAHLFAKTEIIKGIKAIDKGFVSTPKLLFKLSGLDITNTIVSKNTIDANAIPT